MELVRATEVLPEVEAVECSLANVEVSESLEEEVRMALENLKRKTDQWRPFEELHTLILGMSNYLDRNSLEQKTIYARLNAIEKDTKETVNTVKVIALVVVMVAGFWSVIAWSISYDAIRAFFYAANLISHDAYSAILRVFGGS